MTSNPSPPSSPNFRAGQGATGASSGYDESGSRSPGYPSPPASPPNGSIANDAQSSSRKNGSMPPPSASSPRVNAHASKAYVQGMAGYPSMASAAVALQQPVTAQPYSSAQHPPSKLATGGQSHSHRPVSAMPIPTDYSSRAARTNHAAAAASPSVFATSYTERRASAHPTMSSSQSTSAAIAGLPVGMDAATTRHVLSSGIPITSPAAIQYFAAHPRRQQVHFGNYLLLQTLGEGEFGKVKLGVHKEWGEEVAVKLIKRDKVGTNVNTGEKDPAKMSKVEREIQVLKEVRHPNIVRLYEVIESDRYIGIVLEYASGGELFDHILAHKYLKEDHACRLFAQLISGVSYLHEKKIVHRDLKLENLLLDRNRNVIITDFGFANNFEDKRNDLMATSCGSPCYAAPELVVQDGLYAGSAVDVWSCGVILYAMLAGYLPFDDDPANPDGDNINLLYKYIMATPLSFPDYISAEPRDLLSKMLVPDPIRRASLEQVMGHRWLAAYRDLFKFSVEDLERAAMEQQTKKRQVYRQQMLYQQQLQEQQRRQQMERSQSARQVVSPNVPSSPYSLTDHQSNGKAQKHQSAIASSTTVPDRIYDAAGSRAATSSDLLGVPGSKPSREGSQSSSVDPVTALGNARGEPRTRLDDGVASPSSSRKRDSAGTAKESEYRKPAAQKTQRHTIQLEYGGDSQKAKKEPLVAAHDVPPSPVPKSPLVKVPERTTDRTKPEALPATKPASQPASSQINTASSAATVPTATVSENQDRLGPNVAPQPQVTRSGSRASSRAGIPAPIIEQSDPSSPSPPLPLPVAAASAPKDEIQDPKSTKSRVPPARPTSKVVSGANGVSSRVVSNPLPASDSISFPLSGDRVVSVGSGASEANARYNARPLTASIISSNASKTTPERSNSRHRKGLSTDKFFLSRLLGSSIHPSSSSRANHEIDARSVEDASGKVKASPSRQALDRATGSTGKGSARRKAMSLVVGKSSPVTKDRNKALEAHALSLATQRDANAVSEEQSSTRDASEDVASNSKSIPAAPLRQKLSNTSSRPATGSVRQNGSALYDSATIASTSTAGPSSNAAKKVMDWFRKKSLSKGTFNEQPPLGPFERTLCDPRPKSSNTPQVVVTSATSNVLSVNDSSVPSSRSTSGTHSQNSEATDVTQTTSATETSEHSEGVKSSASTVQQPTPKASSLKVSDAITRSPSLAPTSFHESQLRFHLGAVDQSALTSRSPLEIFAEVQQALYDMGIEFRKEKDEDFKLECVRRKRPKTLISATQGLGLSIRTSVFPPSQADLERSSRMSNHASMLASSGMSAAGSLRNFLRRGSQPVSTPGSALLPSTGVTPNAEEPVTNVAGQQPPPLYGDASVDGGQEIRFSVEVTRIKNLSGLYSLDIRRMKGNLWAYKFVYHALLDRSQLAGKSVTSTTLKAPSSASGTGTASNGSLTAIAV